MKGKRMKKMICALLIMGLMVVMAGCTKKCENGCGEPADPDCWADMCDNCCDYWTILTGCDQEHIE